MITTDFNQTDPLLRAIADMRAVVGEAHVALDDDNMKSFLRLQGVDVPITGTLAAPVAVNTVKLAAALALDSIGSSAAMVLKVIKTLELETDGAALASSLQKHAAALRKEVADSIKLAQETALKASSAPRGRSIGSRRVDGYSECQSRAEHGNDGRFCRWN